jgi:hypothetical protein
MSNPFVSKYRQAEKSFDKAEAKLSKHVARLDAARSNGSPDDVTRLRTQAVVLEKEAIKLFDEMEEARRSYWEDRAKSVQASLREFAPGLVSEAAQYWKNSGRPGLQGGTGVIDIVKLCCLVDLPTIKNDSELPESGKRSSVLDAVEDEVW